MLKRERESSSEYDVTVLVDHHSCENDHCNRTLNSTHPVFILVGNIVRHVLVFTLDEHGKTEKEEKTIMVLQSMLCQ